MKKIWPYKVCNYAAFLDNCCECSLIVHQSLTWNCFLRLSWNAEFKMIQMNFLNSVTLKLIGLPFTSNGTFIQTWFYQHHALAYWNAEILKMLTHVLHSVKEISHCITTNLITSLWQALKLLAADKIFQKSNICLKAQIFQLAINTVSRFLWSDRLLLLNFPSSAYWSNPGFPDIGVWWDSMVFNSVTQALSRGRVPGFQHPAPMFFVCFSFASYSIKKIFIQGLRFNKIRNFYHCVENVLRWNWQFVFPVIAWSNTTTVQFGDTALTGAETLQVLATTAFVPSVPMSTQLKRPIMS